MWGMETEWSRLPLPAQHTSYDRLWGTFLNLQSRYWQTEVKGRFTTSWKLSLVRTTSQEQEGWPCSWWCFNISSGSNFTALTYIFNLSLQKAESVQCTLTDPFPSSFDLYIWSQLQFAFISTLPSHILKLAPPQFKQRFVSFPAFHLWIMCLQLSGTCNTTEQNKNKRRRNSFCFCLFIEQKQHQGQTVCVDGDVQSAASTGLVPDKTVFLQTTSWIFLWAVNWAPAGFSWIQFLHNHFKTSWPDPIIRDNSGQDKT